jgi:outer membrane protein with beta-barrel domain
MHEMKTRSIIPPISVGQPRRFSFALLMGVASLLCPWAAQAQYKLCFPSTTWFGGTPSVDGKVIGDNGWSGGFRYVFGNGSTTPFAVVQGVRDGSNNLYLSFEGEGLPSLDQYTVVVIGFDFRASGGALQKVSVRPVVSSPVIQTNPANIVGVNSGPVKFWLGTANLAGQATWTQVGPPAPSWLLSPNNQVGYLQQPTGDYHWFLEMKLPITGNGTPAAGITLPTMTGSTFGLYINVFRVVSGQYQESWWPPTMAAYESGCLLSSPCTNPDDKIPDPGPLGASNWGTASIDPTQSCKGVSVQSQANDIFTNNTPNSYICLNNSTAPHCNSATPNIFTVNVDNNTVDGNGAGLSAPNVEATFSIANFGLQSMWDPSQWTKINVTHNPTSPVTLAANSTNTQLSTDSWFPVQPNASLYDPNTGHPHQCIMVTLDSTSGNVVFINNAAIQNMDFVNASKFERVAEINAKGYPARPDNPDGSHNTDQIFDLQILSKAEVLNPGQAATVANRQGTYPGEGKRVVSQLTWTVHGCRHTGRFFTAGESKIEVCDPVGAFGYVIRHVGNAAVKDWNLQFTGPGLERVPGQPNTYRIHVPKDGAVTVTTHAEPKEKNTAGGGKVAVFFDAGAAIPHGTFGNAFNTGFSLNAGLEYIITSHFSAEGIFGYHHFPAKTVVGAVLSDLNLYQFSANGKAYLTNSWPFRPFINAGIGGYHFTPGGNTYFGGNVGAGLLRRFNSHWGVQASYNLHTVDVNGTATKFSTAQIGVRFVF